MCQGSLDDMNRDFACPKPPFRLKMPSAVGAGSFGPDARNFPADVTLDCRNSQHLGTAVDWAAVDWAAVDWAAVDWAAVDWQSNWPCRLPLSATLASIRPDELAWA